MSTTLNEARTMLIRLSAQFPAPSSYATQLASIADYLDKQIPLNVENQSLRQRIKVLEAHIDGVRKALPEDPAIVTVKVSETTRSSVECTSWMGRIAGPCKCIACRVREHA